MVFEKDPTSLYQIYPTTVAVIGARYGDELNFMAAAWHTLLSFNPPIFGVSISPKRYTHDLLMKSGEFTASFLGHGHAELVEKLGRTSGSKINKVLEYGLELLDPRVVKVPGIGNAVAVYECRVLESRSYGDHTFFVGRIVGLHYDPRAFDEVGRPAYDPVLYLGKDVYVKIDRSRTIEFDPEKFRK